MTEYKLQTMEDLFDHTAKDRAEILPAHGQIASIEFDIAEINERLRQAVETLQEAESLTAGFEAKAASGNAKNQERAEQQLGAHLVKVMKLRADLATVQSQTDEKLPTLNEELRSAKDQLSATEKNIKYGRVRNAWQLLMTRLNDGNIAAVALEFFRAAQNAGVYLGNDERLLDIFDPKAQHKVGPYDVHIHFRPERFNPEPEPADPELAPISDEPEVP